MRVLHAILIAVTSASLTSCAGAQLAYQPNSQILDDPIGSPRNPDLIVDFGLHRDPETGSLLLDVCAPKRDRLADKPRQAESLVENRRGRCVSPKKVGRTKPAANRPGISAVSVLFDPIPCDVEEPAPSDPRFPADQLTTSAELVGTTGLRVVVVADPNSPEEPEPGEYCGRLVVERDGARYQAVDFAVSLTDRGGKAAWLAFGYLLFGAIVGVLIRFLNDPVAKLVSPYRRYRTVSRWVASLPAGVDAEGKLQGKLMDVEDALMFLDVAAANAALTELEELRSTSVDAAALRQGIAGVSSAPQRDRKTVPQPKRWRRIVFGMFHVYWVLALLALIIGVVAIGFVTRYVQNDAFSGTQRDWVGLVVFGLAAQITATTLSESLGRLLPSARSRS